MNYSDENYELLKEYEPYFQTAVRSDWARGISMSMLATLRRIFEETTGRPYPMRGSCGTCQLHLLKDAGTLWFQDKEAREALEGRVTHEEVADEKTPAPKVIAVKRAKKAVKKESK